MIRQWQNLHPMPWATQSPFTWGKTCRSQTHSTVWAGRDIPRSHPWHEQEWGTKAGLFLSFCRKVSLSSQKTGNTIWIVTLNTYRQIDQSAFKRTQLVHRLQVPGCWSNLFKPLSLKHRNQTIPFPLAAASSCLKAVVISTSSAVIIKFVPRSQKTGQTRAGTLPLYCWLICSEVSATILEAISH